MILEEIIGSILSIGSSLITQTPRISRESLQREYTLIFEENPELEDEENDDGLVHREYKQETPVEVPYYEEDISVLAQPHDERLRRNLTESFRRSCTANICLIVTVVLTLVLLTIGFVYIDLNTTNACIEWRKHNLTIPWNVRLMQCAGIALAVLPLYSWLPACLVMLWGFKEFRKNYLLRVCVGQVVIGFMDGIYGVVIFKKIADGQPIYRIPGNVLFVFSILIGVYLVARKFKQINAETSYSLSHIFVILSFTFLASCLAAYIYTYAIIKFFNQTESRIKKAIIAALTPGIIFPVTAITKYLVLRKGSEMIPPDRAFVLCYFLRGGSIALYRTMQSGLQDIWLFIGLSLLHGVSNVLSKATLNLRIKIWKSIIKCFNKTWCGPRLEVQPFNSPRIRRFNADLEIQNILFEYTTIILSQVYLVCYLVMSFDVPRWQVIKDSLVRIGISVAIDFVFNVISVFIQIHFHDIPMRRVCLNHWRLHVIANALIIIIIVAYFGASLVSVFGHQKYIEDYHLRTCKSVF